jgi:prephenate dehydrogenase
MYSRRATHRYHTVAIIGVGLIGGSIGLALRGRRLVGRVIGIGRRKASLAKAQDCGCVDETTTSVSRGVAKADLVVVCTPIESIPEFIAEAAEHAPADAYLTDAGSTKETVVGKTEALLHKRQSGPLRFIGSHPIAGGEKTGAEAASGRLFRKRTCVITPTAATDDEAVAAVEHFWRLLGAKVVRMSPAGHDAALARTSHVPHLVASALAAATPAEMLPLTGTGWSDTTRIAAGDVELWRQIVLSNSVHTLKALDDFGTVIARLRQALQARDGHVLADILAEGKRRRDALGS